MSRQLVIVESPAKAKTIKKYLGNDFEVLASYGHVRDLLPREGAVDVDHGFAMTYQLIDKNARHVDAISRALRKADRLVLATDPDREGEAISWHLYELLQEKGLLKNKEVVRVVFHEITKRAVQEAVAAPRQLSFDLVNAQQARRALDYLVGFNLSPLLWRKIRRGLSAGRVQSPALRLIVEREEEIERFERREYWSIEADAAATGQPFRARLTHYGGEKLHQFSITDGENAAQITRQLTDAASGKLTVVEVERKERKRNPSPPFTTSTLQQEASRKLGFTAQRTMRTAQTLYEGIDIGGETVGLISYMRTDSFTLAEDALVQIRDYILDRFGQANLPPEARRFKTKSKNAQEAHEAIRPTSVQRSPETLSSFLSRDQLRLYELIWKRTIACQMIHATIATVAVDLAAGSSDNLFRASGSTILHPGFIAVYQEGRDDGERNDDEEGILPAMARGDIIDLGAIRSEQHFTEPPPRYTEATLVKALEEFGIGRPSTYAAIISTLQQREYVEMDKKRFIPTDVGRVVNKFLTQHFTRYVDYDFTARLEDELDAVARGEEEWVPLMQRFWQPFKLLVDDKAESVKRSDVTSETIDEACPKCGKPLSIRLGRNGRFIGCTAYPECDYTRNLNDEGEERAGPEIVEGKSCPLCNAQLVIRQGKYGKFVGCSAYPKCRHMEPLERPQDTGVPCPKCHNGTLVRRKSRRGKEFFSCSTYPKCDYAIWNEPINEPCPQCGWPILTLKTSQRKGTERLCPQKECGFSEAVETSEG
jgi:DNA topoisomerase I